MREACNTFNTPVTGGNVSFYNENPENAVFPTPVIGMLGLVEDMENHIMTPTFKEEGDIIFYVGADRQGLGGSEYLNTIHGLCTGDAPEMDLSFEAQLQRALLSGIRSGNLNAVHDLSDGGLAVTLAEMAIFSGHGAQVETKGLDGQIHEVLYSEAQSGVVVTASAKNEQVVQQHFADADIPCVPIGKVQGTQLVVDDHISVEVKALHQIYESVLPNAMAD